MTTDEAPTPGELYLRATRSSHLTPDWCLMIEQLLAKGLTHRDIGDAMSSVLTVKMIRHYRLGVQPLHWRGEALIGLWCGTVNAKREDIPRVELIRGHRVARRETDTAPRLQNLPQWPTAPAPSVKPVKRRQRGAVAV